MTRSVEARLHNLERSAFVRSRMDISDAELLGALDRRRLDETHLRALYRRIEKPHAAAILVTGWAISSWWPKMSESERANCYIISISYLIAAHLAWPAGTAPRELVGDYGDPLTRTSRTLPLTDDRRTNWEIDLRCWLAQHFVSTRGRKTLQAQIVQAVEASADAPILAWRDPDGRVCSSQKRILPDKSGHRWTYWLRAGS